MVRRILALLPVLTAMSRFNIKVVPCILSMSNDWPATWILQGR